MPCVSKKWGYSTPTPKSGGTRTPICPHSMPMDRGRLCGSLSPLRCINAEWNTRHFFGSDPTHQKSDVTRPDPTNAKTIRQYVKLNENITHVKTIYNRQADKQT